MRIALKNVDDKPIAVRDVSGKLVCLVKTGDSPGEFTTANVHPDFVIDPELYDVLDKDVTFKTELPAEYLRKVREAKRAAALKDPHYRTPDPTEVEEMQELRKENANMKKEMKALNKKMEAMLEMMAQKEQTPPKK